MFKYFMTINHKPYTALFDDHFEAAQFLDENDAEGDEVIVHRFEFISPLAVLNDEDFPIDYRVERAATFLLPRWELNRYKKSSEILAAMKEAGYTW